MVVRTRNQLKDDADTLLPDNTSGLISPEDVRERVKDLADSAIFAEDGPFSMDNMSEGADAKIMTAAERSKLNGIAASATANDSDANLKNRANHTGSQLLATISDAGTAASRNVGTGSGNVPILDAGGKLAESTIPAVAITDTFEVATQVAMLALTAQRGDVAVRSDLNKSFILKAEPASTLANWVELRTPTDAVLSVAGKTGSVTLAKGDVGLGNVDNSSDANKPVSTAQQNALNSKFDIPSGTTSQYIRGDGSLATFPAIPAGTVTSVGLSAPTGFSVSGSPVSGAGTLTFAYASGYTGFTTTLQTKLNGIAAGATANQSDAFLLDRANHTGVMPLSGIASPNNGPFVIGKVSTGGVAELPFSDAPTASTIARRAAGGVLRVGAPTSDDHATTKLYVDATLATKETLGEQAGINTQTGVAYTLELSDKGKVVEMNNGAANTLTIPANADVAFPINTRIDVVQYGAGQTTISGDTGVVIYSADGNTKLNKHYSGATLYKRSTNGWVLIGDLVA